MKDYNNNNAARLDRFEAKGEYRASHTDSMARTKRNLLTKKLAKPEGPVPLYESKRRASKLYHESK